VVRPDACDFARAIDEVLTKDSLWHHRAQVGRQVIERQFSEGAATRAYAELYAELVPRARRRSR
jgi:glycosyltransferase involved in cell wall biosynthesis